MDATIETMCHKTRDLRRQLRKAMVDHVSDSSIEGSTPLMMLVEAAPNGDEKAVDESSGVFTEHAAKLVEVGNVACSLSANEDVVKMVRYCLLYTSPSPRD